MLLPIARTLLQSFPHLMMSASESIRITDMDVRSFTSLPNTFSPDVTIAASVSIGRASHVDNHSLRSTKCVTFMNVSHSGRDKMGMPRSSVLKSESSSRYNPLKLCTFRLSCAMSDCEVVGRAIAIITRCAAARYTRSGCAPILCIGHHRRCTRIRASASTAPDPAPGSLVRSARLCVSNIPLDLVFHFRFFEATVQIFLRKRQ